MNHFLGLAIKSFHHLQLLFIDLQYLLYHPWISINVIRKFTVIYAVIKCKSYQYIEMKKYVFNIIVGTVQVWNSAYRLNKLVKLCTLFFKFTLREFLLTSGPFQAKTLLLRCNNLFFNACRPIFLFEAFLEFRFLWSSVIIMYGDSLRSSANLELEQLYKFIAVEAEM